MKMEIHVMKIGFLGYFNDWYPMSEKVTSNIERCLGFENREGMHWSDGNRIIFTYQLYDKMLNMEEQCDDHVFWEVHDHRNVIGDKEYLN
jgi:hypothetical protein